MFSDVEVQKLLFEDGEKWGSFSLGFDHGLRDEISRSSNAAPRLQREPGCTAVFACTNPGRAAHLVGSHFSA